jgi:uncharacterized membrane protein YhaH (DUF805 family)
MLSFHGRVGRGWYWASVLIALFLNWFGPKVGRLGSSIVAIEPFLDAVPIAIGAICWVLSRWVLLSAAIQRIHDRGRSGWWAVLAIVSLHLYPLISGSLFWRMWMDAIAIEATTLMATHVIGITFNLGIMLWLFIDFGILRGQEGPNRYGSDPKAPA